MRGYVFLVLLMSSIMYSQVTKLKVGNSPFIVSPAAVMEVESTTKGFLLPRMRSDQRLAISPNATTEKGLQVFDTTTNSIWYWNGLTWVEQSVTGSSPTYTGSTTITLNGTSFERAALTGDVTASANNNTTTIANNAVTSAKILDGTITSVDIADGAITAPKLNQMSATIGQVLKWNGINWAPATDTDTDTNTNIFTNDGILASDRIVGQVDKTLAFTSTATTGSSHFTVDGSTFNVNAVNNNIGIGTSVPHSNAILDLTATNKGLLLPRIANTAVIETPVNGMMIYDISSNCVKFYENNAWTECVSAITPTATVEVNCSASSFVGSYMKDVALTSNNKFVVTIINNSFAGNTIAFDPSDLVLSGVSGITVASVSPLVVTMNPGGTQVIEYTLSGTPTSAGTLIGTWTKIALNCVKPISVSLPAISSLDCAGVTKNGTLAVGAAASGVSAVFAYTGGDGTAYGAQSLTSTGVTGLTASIAAGNFATGAGMLTYTISGTPSASGTASFTINIGGKSCNLDFTVSPASITLAIDQSYTILSVFDQDYLPFSPPTAAATANALAADGVNESVIYDVQGSIPTTGISIKIPVTATVGAGTLAAYSNTISIPVQLTQDGISRSITLSWSAQSFSAGTTFINATIAAVGGALNVKKLDLNTGIGNNGLGFLMASFTYPYNSAGNTASFGIRILPAIPDKMFGKPDNSGNITHNMLYMPITGPDGKTWLNNNLGAHYANLNHPNFSPGKQAVNWSDGMAYGSLFQWGRKPDGHELINSSGSSVYGTTTTRTSDPWFPEFITSNFFNNWRSNDGALWASESSGNNPCPVGYRVPTSAELANASGFDTSLKLTLPGLRAQNGNLAYSGLYGFYWSSEQAGSDYATASRYINNGYYDSAGFKCILGHSVRCIKN